MSPAYFIIKTSIKRCTGMTVGGFATLKLGCSYPAFLYRVNHNAIKVEEYHILNLYTGLTFEMIFPNPYTKVPDKVKLNLAPMKHPLDIKKPKLAHPMALNENGDGEDEMLRIAERRRTRQLPSDQVEDISRADFNPKEKPQEVKPGADSDDPYGGRIPVDD